MTVMGVVYGIFAFSLWFQGSRWGSTPAYHNLLEIMRQPEWGTVFGISSALLLTAAWQYRRRWLSIIALTLAFAITTGWGGDFIVRWLTSANTTPETWCSWGVFDYMLLRAASKLDEVEVTLPRRHGDDNA